MRRITATILLLVVLFPSVAPATAAKVDLLFSKSVMNRVFDLKDEMGSTEFVSTNAMSLFNMPAAREEAYLSGQASVDAVLILEDACMKAAGAIKFTKPVIIVDSEGATAAVGPVIRLFTAGSAPAGAEVVSDASQLAGKLGAASAGSPLVIQLQGVDLGPALEAMLP